MVFFELWLEVGVPSSCHVDLRVLLMVTIGSQESCLFVRCLSGFPWGRCNGRGPHLQLSREPQSSSPVLTWISGYVQFQTGSQVSTCVKEWNSAFLSSCKRVFRPPVELNWGPGACLEFSTGVSVLPSCCELILRVPFESVQGNQALNRVDGELRVSRFVARPLGSSPVSSSDRPPPEV